MPLLYQARLVDGSTSKIFSKTLGVFAILCMSVGLAFSQKSPFDSDAAIANSKPRLGCYGYPADKPTNYFCLRARNVMLSEVWGYKEGFGECGKYELLAGNRISFSWPGSSEGTIVRLEDTTKPIVVKCTTVVSDAGTIELQDCAMEGLWRYLPPAAFTPTIEADSCVKSDPR